MQIGINNDNSYLLRGDKAAVIECVNAENTAAHLENIKRALNGADVDYIILNHTSPENTGSLEALMLKYPKAVIVSSAAGIKNLTELLNRSFEYMIAKDGAVLDLGCGAALLFEILPNLPWTDSMASYYEKEKTLFCGSIFSDKDGYFENFISMYGEYAKNAVERLERLDIQKILPMSGGEITEIGKYFDEYTAEKKTEEFAAVFYSSCSGYTAEMAELICVTFEGKGMKTVCFDADTADMTEMLEAVNSCSRFAVGTNTVNRNAAKPIWELLTGIDMVNRKYTPCLIFGSCGWSGEGVYLVERFLKSIRMNIFGKPFLVNFRMSGEERERLAETAAKFIDERYE